jgi:hypothetical protein
MTIVFFQRGKEHKKHKRSRPLCFLGSLCFLLLLGWIHVFERPDLAFALEFGPMYTVQVHESSC